MTNLVSKITAKTVLRIAAAAGLGLGLTGCVYDAGLGLSYASDNYGGYNCDPYSPFDSYYSCDYQYGFSNIGYGGGWHNSYYYPGHGFFVFDSYGRRFDMQRDYQRYWGQRRYEWYRGRNNGGGYPHRNGYNSHQGGGIGGDHRRDDRNYQDRDRNHGRGDGRDRDRDRGMGAGRGMGGRDGAYNNDQGGKRGGNSDGMFGAVVKSVIDQSASTPASPVSASPISASPISASPISASPISGNRDRGPEYIRTAPPAPVMARPMRSRQEPREVTQSQFGRVIREAADKED